MGSNDKKEFNDVIVTDIRNERNLMIERLIEWKIIKTPLPGTMPTVQFALFPVSVIQEISLISLLEFKFNNKLKYYYLNNILLKWIIKK